MPLKLILVSPDKTVFADGKGRSEVIKDLITFIQRMAAKKVQVALWSRHRWTLDGEALDAYLSSRSGVTIRHFVAAEGKLKARQYGGSVDPILAELGIERHETILLGAGDTDFKAGVNNGLLLIRPAWYEDQIEYGFRVSSIGRLARFCEVFGLREHPIYWFVDDDPLRVISMGPFSTYIEAFAGFGANARSVAKDNVGDARFWFLMIVSSLYFSGVAHVTDYICPFPGHDPSVTGTTRALLDNTMSLFGKCFRKPYLPDLIVRHTKSLKSQKLTASTRTFTNHLNSIHLNRYPRSYDNDEPRKSALPLRSKTVLVVDDFLTHGRSLDTARAFINAAGGKALLFAWLKTINTSYLRMSPDPKLMPFQPNTISSEPASVAYGYHPHVADPDAPQEINQVFDAYRQWTWP
ncbi:phosphoribosyltransferase [Acidisphaera sp. S103]|uniref:phosphoribosyltransferase n=1 Tax=Acidisphaera sp. S103 TaxID=1747223 RepID=UPI00131D8364|nr:phosphoribosyltransferase [Acidisphaera sp. S103]